MTVIRRVLLAILLAYWGMILVFTHVPGTCLPPVHVSDKMPHFLGYFALAALLYGCIWLYRPGLTLTPVIVLAVCATYGAIDEYTQLWVRRSADFNDWTADVAGAALAVILLGLAQWRTVPPQDSSRGLRRSI